MTGKATQDPSSNGRVAQTDDHATTTGMTGHGFYDENSQTQWNAIAAVLPTLDKAVAALRLPDNGVITLADYGCSEGRNSIAAMERALKTLLARTPLPVQTVHSDLPTNDFSTLFLNLRQNGQSVFGHRPDFFLGSRRLHVRSASSCLQCSSRDNVQRHRLPFEAPRRRNARLHFPQRSKHRAEQRVCFTGRQTCIRGPGQTGRGGLSDSASQGTGSRWKTAGAGLRSDR